MDPSSDNRPTPSEPAATMANGFDNLPPANWREALVTLLTARAALVQLEAKEAATSGAKIAISLAIALVCVLFSWALILVGGTALVAKATQCPWPFVALIIAVIHLFVALLLVKSARKPSAPAFPVTRAEFQRDREWIENFQKTPKSGV